MSSTTCPAKRDFTTPLLQDQALRIPGQLQTQARVNEILQQMNLPPHAAQAQISTAIRMIEKYGTEGLLCRCCKKAKLQLLYVVDVKGHKEVQRE